jgi:hypothetical protein
MADAPHQISSFTTNRHIGPDVILLRRVAALFFFIAPGLDGGGSTSSEIEIDLMIEGDHAHA